MYCILWKNSLNMKQTFRIMSLLVVTVLTVFISSGSSFALVKARPICIGALLSLTGNWSSLGITSKTLLEMAEQDVNAYLSAHGSHKKVALMVRDTRLDPDEALEQFRKLIRKNVVAVIGPQSSSEVAQLKYLADTKKVPILSQGSTASSLAIPNDKVYRLVPDDSHESAAMLALLEARNVKVVLPVWRNDAGNEGLYQSLKNQFEAAKGSFLTGVNYEANTTDFSEVVNEIQEQLDKALQNNDASEVAVYLAGFDEVVSLFSAADKRLNLKSVKWYGSDGVALSATLLNDGYAAKFASAVDYPNPLPGLSQIAKEKWQVLSDRVFATIHRRPDAFALAAYDAFWIAALNASYNKKIERHAEQDILSQTADLFFGVTGWTELNSAGDRSYGDYDFWALRPDSDGKLQWQRVCRYEDTPGVGKTLSCLENED